MEGLVVPGPEKGTGPAIFYIHRTVPYMMCDCSVRGLSTDN